MTHERTSPSAHSLGAKAELEAHGLRPKRTLGQNFLADEGLCAKLADLVAAPPAKGVLEIGAGLGALTGPLLERGCQVVAVETDASLAKVLRAKFALQIADGRLRLIEGDARELDLAELLRSLPAPRVLAGNLPYNLSGLLLRRAVDLCSEIQRSVFLLQLEVVARLCAGPGTADYGALSVFAQSVYTARRAFVVRRGAFYPQPAVDSAVAVLEPIEGARAPSEDFGALVRSAFEQRRKTLRNAWRDVLGLSGPELEEAARRAGIDLRARGETLGVADFARLASAIRERSEAG